MGCITLFRKRMLCRVEKASAHGIDIPYADATIAKETDPEHLLLWILRLDFLLYLWVELAFKFPVRPLRSFSFLGFLMANGNVYRADANGRFHFGA